MKGVHSRSSTKTSHKKGVSKMKEQGTISLIDQLLKRNAAQAKEFSEGHLVRRLYRAQHPTEIVAFKCMDGRLNLSYMTETPVGYIQPYRDLGGRFDMGSPYFGSLIQRGVESAVNQGRGTIIFVTYHFSVGKKERGCKGFHCNVDEAKNFTAVLCENVKSIFGDVEAVYPIQVGIETDHDALVFHGRDGSIFDLSQVHGMSAEDFSTRLHSLYPDMNECMVKDLVPLLIGNQHHIKKIREMNRQPIELDHREQVLAFGRGFDWLHEPNKALIVGPYALDIEKPIVTAASIILDNLNGGRIPKEDGVVLMIASLYERNVGPDKRRAVEKSRSLAQFAQAAIKKGMPKLEPYMKTLVGIVDAETRLFTPLEQFEREEKR